MSVDYHNTWLAPGGDAPDQAEADSPSAEPVEIELPQPGIHKNVAFSEYCQWPALNSSALAWESYSMLHVRAYLDGRLTKKTEPLRFGRAVHCRLLEPDLYYSSYLKATACQGVLKKPSPRAGQRCNAPGRLLDPSSGYWFCRKHGPEGSEEPEDYVTVEDAQDIELMVASIKDHPVVKLLRQPGTFEASNVWRQDDYDCKSRYDKVLTPDAKNIGPAIVDVKKTSLGGARLWAFSKAIVDYHYDMKAAMYREGYYHSYDVWPRFFWIAIEDKPPFAVNVIQADDDTNVIGAYKWRRAFEKYDICMLRDEWPGYGCPGGDIRLKPGVVLGGVPDFERRKLAGILVNSDTPAG